jgi:hypothetical protein
MMEQNPAPAFQITPAPIDRISRCDQAVLKQIHIMLGLEGDAVFVAFKGEGVLKMFCNGKQVGRIVLSGS